MVGFFDVGEAGVGHKAVKLVLGDHAAAYEGFVELDAGHHLVGGIATVIRGGVGVGKLGDDDGGRWGGGPYALG